MKKYLVLTLILALAACGGGSGGGGSHNEQLRAAVAPEIASSNSGITGMSSEIVVASNSNSPVSVVRKASATTNGVTYTSYRLDDVNLYTAQNFDGETYLNLNVDKNTGEINAIKMYVGGEDSGLIGRTIEDGHFINSFNGPVFEYVVGGDRAVFRVADTGQTMADLNNLVKKNKLPAGGRWDRMDTQMVFNTLGNGTDLQYADFGYFNPVTKEKNKNVDATVLAAIRTGKDAVLALGRGDELDKYYEEEKIAKKLASKDYELFAGGYAINGTSMERTLLPENNSSYSGTAIGRVYASIETEDGYSGINKHDALEDWGVPYDDGGSGYTDNAGHDMANLYTTHGATLEIDASGNKLLIMPFNSNAAAGSDKYYDIAIAQNNDNEVTSVRFYGDESLIGNQYKDHGAFGRNGEGYVDMDYVQSSNFQPGYYGVNSPDEAAGTAYLEANVANSGVVEHVQRDYGVEAAWGMKKDYWCSQSIKIPQCNGGFFMVN